MKIAKVPLILSSVLAVSACSNQSMTAADYIKNSDNLTWQAITFGQSTDLNFGSTILPEKVGVNQVTINGQPVKPGPVAGHFTIESRGGKIANSHEGGTFYYTKLPTDVNFTLSAQVVLSQLGPETGSTPNRQEGAGLMVRDILGNPRQNPQPEGTEEFPAASNMAMNLLRANKKANNGLININAAYREGIYQPWGTAHNHMSKKAFLKGLTYGEKQPFHMTLTRTNKGYTVSFDNGKVHKTYSMKGAHANIVEMQNPDYQYVGFFASRNAKIKVSDVKLTLSKAQTEKAPRYQPKQVATLLQRASSTESAVSRYVIQARANYAGTYTASQDGRILINNKMVKAGTMFSYPTTLTKAKTPIEVTFVPTEGPSKKTIHDVYTVERKQVAHPMRLVVNPKGTNGRLDLATAVKLLPPGGTIVMEPGDYSELNIPVAASGTPEQRKTLQASKGVRVTGPYLHEGNYWNIANLEVDGGRTIVHGSYNHFDHMLTHNSPDTGFQISSTKTVGRPLWASYNIVRDSESYNNMDKSQINADGFAVKMRVGDGNTLIRCISHHNIDDGYDLFNKVEDGPDGAVTIIDSIAYMNGQTMKVKNKKGGTRGNGFKLGGEGLPVAHVVKGNLSFRNSMDGFTDNFNPGSLTVEDNVSIDNKRFNFLFRKSPYKGKVKQGTFEDNRSYRFYVSSKYSDVVNAYKKAHNDFISHGKTTNDKGTVVPVANTLKKAAFIPTSHSAADYRHAVNLIEEIIKTHQDIQ
ncbi:right-handed parallel beta-helix repeat-containing protein [Vibrio salinus]|uniref:right-handed parallel beta-helix repeat-containing protein n=1 Tax=Vibrio salinus TaxID=2899784 RepID=UPI001E3E3843|nr:exopolygalacturonate lyase [Vibrio salinus]MCE0496049.1 exopolygalacturonate lyase [Vibrio salinus]